MRYKRLPVEVCGPQRWPAGPFEPAEVEQDDGGLASAAATVGCLAAALTHRRQEYGWSRAMLARQSGVGQHTIGRIETGRTWPDLATVARLAQTLNLSLTMGGCNDGVRGSAPTAGLRPLHGCASADRRDAAAGSPLVLGSSVSAAQVIEALFAREPRLASEVATLRRNRLQAGQGGQAPEEPVVRAAPLIRGSRR